MPDQEKSHSILKTYGRAIVHMRAQKELDRFGLVFGAGISKDFGFPDWEKLVKRIACDERVNGEDFCNDESKKDSRAQLLFQNFKANLFSEKGNEFAEYDKFSAYVQSEWSKIVHDALYQDVPNNVEDLQDKDSCLFNFLDIVKESRLTINYNFDDTIQTLLAAKRTQSERDEIRGYRTVWNADIQLYPQRGVIYHPNGFIPHKEGERPSDDLIFLEDSFGDQLIDSSFGHYAALSYHLSQNTCLFIGLSLEDSTLKHLLRKNSNLHPGHVHYYVHFLEDTNSLDENHKKTISDANFDVYNLVTMFLDKEDLKTLAYFLECNTENFEYNFRNAKVELYYKFFLTGSVSVGKSTAVSYFRSLQTHDEWLENRAAGMEKDPKKVSEKEIIKQIDQWVVDQWRKKNFILTKRIKPGIHIVDRCPLDAFAFTPENEWIDKAKFTREGIILPDSEDGLVKGKIILLIGEPEIMSIRALRLQKEFNPDDLKKMQDLLKIVYDKEMLGVSEIDTREKPAKQVAKEICKIIHLDDYEECNIKDRLSQIEDGIIRP